MPIETEDFCVDLIATKADPMKNFYRVRFRNPKLFVGGDYTTPSWAKKSASSIGERYYGVPNCMITMAKPKDGNWMIQSILIPMADNTNEEVALKIANHIQDRIEREGQWSKVVCKDNERKRFVGVDKRGQHIIRDSRGRFAPYASEEFEANGLSPLQSILEEMEMTSYKYLSPLSDGRIGVIVIDEKRARRYHQYLKGMGLKPTVLSQTKYGFAFKFNPTEKVIPPATDTRYWPYTMVPQGFRGGDDGYILLDSNDDIYLWKEYKPDEGYVRILENRPLKTVGSSTMKHHRVPYPAKRKSKTKSVMIWEMFRPIGKPFMATEQLKFLNYEKITWFLNLESGKWTKTEENEIQMLGNDEFSQLLLTLV